MKKSERKGTDTAAAMEEMQEGDIRPFLSDEEDDKKRDAFVPRRLFLFDPNSASPGEWHELGVREKTVNTIRHFLDKGGQFRKPDDLKKIYGLAKEDFERLLPYIRINKKEKVRDYYPRYHPDTLRGAPWPKWKPHAIDINMADSAAFSGLPGIGAKLSARILRFRESLGGFCSIRQVGETFGLPDSVFLRIQPYLQLSHPSVRKIMLNEATYDELKAHPYIRWNIARAILAYRDQHGPFPTIASIKNIVAITDSIYLKLAPYLSVP